MIKDIIKSLLVIGASSVIGSLFYNAGFSEANIIMVYILGVLINAAWTNGRIYSALFSLFSVIVFNFLFTVPRFTLFAYDASYPVTFLIMLVAGVLTSSLATQIKIQAKQAASQAYRTGVLLETSQILQKADSEKEILDFTGQQMNKLLERPIFFYERENNSGEEEVSFYPGKTEALQKSVQAEKIVLDWVYEKSENAGAATSIYPEAKNLYMPVKGRAGVMAVAGISAEGYEELDDFVKNLLMAILDECGLAMSKERFRMQKQQAEMIAKQESLRANLLRTISHDLRTPLTSISGNAGILMENEKMLDDKKRHELYRDIYDDSMWLANLVENLLSVTRLENGTMQLKMEAELIEEVFHEAMQHLDRGAKQHIIETKLTDDLLMARMDVQLIIQVIVNILNNAIKYTPEGSRIILAAYKSGEWLIVNISDNGCGIRNEAKNRVFDMFFTDDNVRGDGRRGLGLGLALCKAIVNAHGGKIWVEDNDPKGAVFCFSLKAVEVDSVE